MYLYLCLANEYHGIMSTNSGSDFICKCKWYIL